MSVTALPYLYGDTASPLGDHAVANSDSLIVSDYNFPNVFLTLVGDAPTLYGHAIGGDDAMLDTQTLDATAIGDALLITDHAQGGNDALNVGTSYNNATGYGDALTINGSGVGGNDIVNVSSAHGSATAYGDAIRLGAHAQGGNDTVSAVTDDYTFSVTTYMYGDADTLQGHAQGGNDWLQDSNYSLGRTHVMYGDGRVLAEHATGGNDTLVAGLGTDVMYGDAAVVGDHATTGSDLFVVAGYVGSHAQIMDFEQGKDHIEFSPVAMVSNFNDVLDHLYDTPDGAYITFGTGNGPDVTIHGISASQLTASDFLFA